MGNTAYSLGKTLLKVESVTLEYDGRPILKNVNAEVRDVIVPGRIQGQVVGFLGPSGCGKTSLFRIIAGLNEPTSGRVTVNGLDRPVRAGEVGVVAQSYPLFEHRTVMSNLMLAAQQKESSASAAKDKVMSYLREFELEDKYNLYPAQLSGGQRQRCAIIQQILCSEHFLLMDEPFSGLDLLMLEKTCELIAKVANMDELNTIIVVTHDVTAACSVADHIWLMGRDTDAAGNKVPGSRIMKEYNLIDMDLCWHPGIITSSKFTEFVREVKEDFRKL
ncbi:ABC transporter, ATPase subunit [Candidatus Koribacter versatilis Ellin345]|uniref:ABC transporter, ATPase subunit n=1 Tax=Koribacter versatilis (strain Ellin345) TaxID=204669 RepID=Q1III1_KORVE|nr:ATP-binding cassette domain-containing protein [Candidatus Koribacter versatilis]ABF43319.1 ABC transporter, ATPase subunit [Candidatus Koribacter versatilis Ellin345]